MRSIHSVFSRQVVAFLLFAVVVTSLSFSFWGVPSHQREVIVYAALDREFSEPIFEEFTRQTGVHVRAKYDTESTKSVQLATAILAERTRPRCDLFWNNEILNTLRLQQNGLLDQYTSRAGSDYPPEYRSPDGYWHGFAARARVLIVNTDVVASGKHPTSIYDLVRSEWKDRVGVAKPLAGTTRTHAVCLFQYLGREKAEEFLSALASNARVMSGNKQVALAVARGQLGFGLTDTDDAMIELEKGFPVRIVYPDQGEGEMGTLFIPNTLGLIKGSPNHDHACQLLEYLLSPAVERRLAQGDSAQIPLNRQISMELRVETPSSIRALQVDFGAAIEEWEGVSRFLEEKFAAAK